MPSGTACEKCGKTFAFKAKSGAIDILHDPFAKAKKKVYYCWNCFPHMSPCHLCRRPMPVVLLYAAATPPHNVMCIRCIKKL